jgi:hypothetical protein
VIDARRPGNPEGMRVVFTAYLVVIAAGLAWFITVGLTHY